MRRVPQLLLCSALCLLAWGCKEEQSAPENGAAERAFTADFPVPFSEIDVDSGRYRIRVRVFGDDAAPALIMVHGFQRSGATFVPLMGALSGRFRLIVPDLPGHGQSVLKAGTGAPPTFDEFDAAILAVADQFNLERFSLLGHSMGGVIAAGFAVGHPERASALVLLEATPTYSWPKSVACTGPCGELLQAENATAAANKRMHGADHYGRIWSAYVAEDHSRVFAMQPLPILWLMNTDDTYDRGYFLAHARTVDPSAPERIRLVTVRERGHFLHWTEPQVVTEAILAFLSDHGKGAG